MIQRQVFKYLLNGPIVAFDLPLFPPKIVRLAFDVQLTRLGCIDGVKAKITYQNDAGKKAGQSHKWQPCFPLRGAHMAPFLV